MELLHRVKSLSLEVIKIFRSFDRGSIEVRIESLKDLGYGYEVIGSYTLVNPLGIAIEEGSFRLVLDRDLKIVSAEVRPREKGIV